MDKLTDEVTTAFSRVPTTEISVRVRFDGTKDKSSALRFPSISGIFVNLEFLIF